MPSIITTASEKTDMTPQSGPSATDPDQIILKLVEAVADARDEGVTDLRPISEAFNPEALEQFLVSTSVPTTIRLEVYECEVELNSEGTVVVVNDGENT